MNFELLVVLALAVAVLATIAVVIGALRIQRASTEVEGQASVIKNARVVLIAVVTLIITGFGLWVLALMLRNTTG